jgi:hypothetical protein
MEQLRQPPKRVVSVACPSWCDLSEVKPHGPTLFQIRPEPFFPKRDRSGLFTPGEKPFISHLVATNISGNMSDYKYLDLFISTEYSQELLTIC